MKKMKQEATGPTPNKIYEIYGGVPKHLLGGVHRLKASTHFSHWLMWRLFLLQLAGEVKER